MEQNLRFGLVLGSLVVLKTAEYNLILATFEAIFMDKNIIQLYLTVRLMYNDFVCVCMSGIGQH